MDNDGVGEFANSPTKVIGAPQGHYLRPKCPARPGCPTFARQVPLLCIGRAPKRDCGRRQQRWGSCPRFAWAHSARDLRAGDLLFTRVRKLAWDLQWVHQHACGEMPLDLWLLLYWLYYCVKISFSPANSCFLYAVRGIIYK